MKSKIDGKTKKSEKESEEKETEEIRTEDTFVVKRNRPKRGGCGTTVAGVRG